MSGRAVSVVATEPNTLLQKARIGVMGLTLAALGLFIGSEVRADRAGTWDCRVIMDAESKRLFSEQIAVGVPSPPWSVVVMDDIIETVQGEPVVTSQVDLGTDRISFGWTLDLSKIGMRGSQGHFWMTIFPSTGKMLISAQIAHGGPKDSVRGQGSCEKVKED